MTIITHIPRAMATVRYTAEGLTRSRSFTILAPEAANDRKLYDIAEKVILDEFSNARIHKIMLQYEGEKK